MNMNLFLIYLDAVTNTVYDSSDDLSSNMSPPLPLEVAGSTRRARNRLSDLCSAAFGTDDPYLSDFNPQSLTPPPAPPPSISGSGSGMASPQKQADGLELLR